MILLAILGGTVVLASLLILGELAWVYRAKIKAWLRRSEPGCCPMCDGGGMSGEECTGGMCWDCQGTGHPHLGRCRSRFLDWWHLRESEVIMTTLVWTIITTAFGAPAFYGRAPWMLAIAVSLSVGPVMLAIVAMIVLGRLADNQIRRFGLPRARRGDR